MIRFRNVRPQSRSGPFVALLVVFHLAFPQTAVAEPAAPNGFSEAEAVTVVQPAQGFDVLARLPDIPRRNARRTLWLTVTAYSSSVDETDGDPFTTASGTHVHDGTLAHNTLPIGTRVRFPEKFGDKIFTVEDRLNARYGPYMADMWMLSKAEAKQWGARLLKMEIL